MITVVTTTLNVTSPAFEHNAYIPNEYSCTGENKNPALLIEGLPMKTESLALIMEDPDAPNGPFVHWIMWNMPIQEKLEEGIPSGVQGKNSKRENRYFGPCPPAGNAHHYYFKVYALDTKLNLPAGADKRVLMEAMNGHVIASGELVGLFKR